MTICFQLSISVIRVKIVTHMECHFHSGVTIASSSYAERVVNLIILDTL